MEENFGDDSKNDDDQNIQSIIIPKQRKGFIRSHSESFSSTSQVPTSLKNAR